jgi:hypothetical protein
MAHLSGAKQYVFKKPIQMYHIDHDSIWKTNTYMHTRRHLVKIGLPYKLVDIISWFICELFPGKSAITNAGIEYSSDKANDVTSEMLNGDKSYLYNDMNWGLGDLNIPVSEIA